MLVAELFTNVPPVAITRFAAFAVVVTVTVCPEAIETEFVQPGTTPPTQVAAVFQSPELAETIAVLVSTALELFIPT